MLFRSREILRDEFGGWRDKRTQEGSSDPVETPTSLEDSLKNVKRAERRKKWKEILIDE